jgi:hypothetical protein
MYAMQLDCVPTNKGPEVEESLTMTFRQLDLAKEMQAISRLCDSNKSKIVGCESVLVTGLFMRSSRRTGKVGELSIRKLLYSSKIRRFVLCGELAARN